MRRLDYAWALHPMCSAELQSASNPGLPRAMSMPSMLHNYTLPLRQHLKSVFHRKLLRP